MRMRTDFIAFFVNTYNHVGLVVMNGFILDGIYLDGDLFYAGYKKTHICCS
jgi:hypothetical protein